MSPGTAWGPMMDCEVCGAPMEWVKAHYACPRCRWVKPCCEQDAP